MTDILGPSNAPNAITWRPADTRMVSSQDTWFRDCSSAAVRDGTQLQASLINQILASLRGLARANGSVGGVPVIPEDNANDNILADSVRALIQSIAVKRAGDAMLGPLTTAGLKGGKRDVTSSTSMLVSDFGGFVGLAGSTPNQTFTLIAESAGYGYVVIANWSSVPWTIAKADGAFTLGPGSWPDWVPIDPGQSLVFWRSGATWFLIAGTGLIAVSKQFRLYGSPASIPSGVETALSGWTSVTSSTLSGTISPSTGVFSPGVTDIGTYVFSAAANTAGSSTIEFIAIYKNSERIAWASGEAAGGGAYIDPTCTSGPTKITASDHVYATYYQDSGTTQVMGTNAANFFGGYRIGL